MELITHLVDAIAKLLWPGLALLVLIMFRKQLGELLTSLSTRAFKVGTLSVGRAEAQSHVSILPDQGVELQPEVPGSASGVVSIQEYYVRLSDYGKLVTFLVTSCIKNKYGLRYREVSGILGDDVSDGFFLGILVSLKAAGLVGEYGFGDEKFIFSSSGELTDSLHEYGRKFLVKLNSSKPTERMLLRLMKNIVDTVGQ